MGTPRTDEWPAGWRVEWVVETGSTNADLFAAASAGAPDRSVRVADHQSAGRGRLDRRWEAPPGANLLVSLLLRDVPAHPHEVTQRVALAALAASERVAGVSGGLKWPNDVVVDGAKLAGVLAQAGRTGGAAFVVVGVGINVGWAPPGAARLGDGVSRRDLLRELLAALDEQPAEIAPDYRARLATIGKQVRVQLGGQRQIVGRAVGVEADGRLVVDDGATIHRIDSGDVVHLRRA